MALASLFADIASEMVYPFLPLFLTETLRVKPNIVGLVEGIALATQNVASELSSIRRAFRASVVIAA